MFLVVLFGSIPYDTLFWHEVQNTGHTISFSVITALVILLLKNSASIFRESRVKLVSISALVCLFLGIAIEVIQVAINSDGNKLDVLRDAGGIVIVLALYVAYTCVQGKDSGASRQFAAGMLVIAIGVLAICLAPLAKISLDLFSQRNAFPVVFDLSARWSGSFVKFNSARVISNSNIEMVGGEAVMIQLEPGRSTYPGLSVSEPYPDWSLYRAFILPIYSRNKAPIDIVLRIHDEHHNNDYSDRFNRDITVSNGANYFRIPIEEIEKSPVGRNLDMQKINNIAIFSDQPKETVSFYLGRITLE